MRRFRKGAHSLGKVGFSIISKGKMRNVLVFVFVFVLECKIERGRRFRKGAHTQSR